MRSPEDLLNGGGAPAVKWSDENRIPQIGKTVKGTVVEVEVGQQRDMEGNLKFWPKKPGETEEKPMEQLVITLQTDERDASIEDDDGIRRIFARGGKKQVGPKGGSPALQAISRALEESKSGHRTLHPGSTFAMQLVELGKPAVVGHAPPHLFIAQYKPGEAGPAVADLI